MGLGGAEGSSSLLFAIIRLPRLRRLLLWLFSPSLSMLRMCFQPSDFMAADSPSARAYGPEKRLRSVSVRPYVEGDEATEPAGSCSVLAGARGG